MRYEYAGYLRTLMHAPDPNAHTSVEHLTFSADDLMRWSLTDRREEKEWQHVPVFRERTAEGTRLEGRFEDVRRIDTLGQDDPSFWVALSSHSADEPRLPIDTHRLGMVELTYRCSKRAFPSWVWTYPGGEHVDHLPHSEQWRTVVRRIPHFGFPGAVTGIIFRLFSATRTTEWMEVQQIRFRAPTRAEAEALRKNEVTLQQVPPPPHYPLLDDFLPLGVYMHTRVTQRIADQLSVPFRDAWRLAMEDLVRMHHNAIALEGIDALSSEERREVLGLAESFGLRVLVMHDWPMDQYALHGPAWIDEHIRPYVDSKAILGWSLQNEPGEGTFRAHLDARRDIEAIDTNHPVAIMTRHPDALPLYGPYFAATGMSFFRSHAVDELHDTVLTHLPLSRGQQFWVAPPAFVWGSDAPAWHTCPEMRLLMNNVFASGARGSFAFTYHNEPIWLGGSCQRSLTGPFLCFSDLWTEMGQRAERFNALAPLFLGAEPGDPGDTPIALHSIAHPRSRLPESRRPAEWRVLQGDDYTLYYILNNDIDEVTAVNIELPEERLNGRQCYDVTDFVRSRQWTPVPMRRHVEMFPGQGQILLLATPQRCDQLRDQMAHALINNDQRQLAVDLALARRYDIEVQDVQQLSHNLGMASLTEDMHHMREARARLINRIYETPQITITRTKLIEVSAMLCACDGTLCRLYGRGKLDLAHELGLKVLPIAQELTALRLRLRRGCGLELRDAADDLARRCLRILGEIRSRL